MAVALLSGCVVTSSASPSGALSASPTPTVVAADTRRALAFSGNCASALTVAQVGSAVGAAVTLDPTIAFADTWAVQQLDGIFCTWTDTSNHRLLGITIIPTATAGAQVAKQDDGQPYCYDDVAAGQPDACSFGTVLGPWWFAGVAYTAEGSHFRSVDAIAALTVDLSPRLAGEDARVSSAHPAMWSTSLDCAAVATVADLATVLADPALTGGNANGGAELGPGVYGAQAAAGYRSCMCDDGNGTGPNAFTIEVIPGAAWVLTQGGLVGTYPATVPGASAAVEAVAAGAPVTYLCVTDGTNLLILEPNTSIDVAAVIPAVAPLLTALTG